MKSQKRKFILISIGISLFLHLLLIWGASLCQLRGMTHLARQAEQMFQIKKVVSKLPKERLPAAEIAAVKIKAPAAGGLPSEEVLHEVQELLNRKLPLPPVSKEELKEFISEVVEKPTGPPGAPEPLQVVRQEIIQIEKETLSEEIPYFPRRVIPQVKRKQGSGLSAPDTLVGEKDILLSRTGAKGGILKMPVPLPVPKKSSPEISKEKKVLEKMIEELEISALKEPKELLQKYPSLDEQLDIKIATFHERGDPRGFFQLTISPKSGQKITPVGKDVLFILDSSVSIGNHRLNFTKKGLWECVKRLKSTDRFNLITFSSKILEFSPSFTSADNYDEKKLAAYFSKIKLEGKTDIYSALSLLTQLEVNPGRPVLVLFLSDGRPTLGLQKSQEIIHRITRDNALKACIYSFGGGRSINRYLLDLLAYRNRGESLIVQKKEDIPRGLAEFFQSISEPIFVDLAVNLGSIDTADIYPKALPNVYQRRSLQIYGRYDKEKIFCLRLVGYSSEGLKEVVWKQSLSEADSGGADIAKQWAYHRIYHLVGRMTDEGKKEEIIREVKYLSRKYNIPTPYAKTFLFWNRW